MPSHDSDSSVKADILTRNALYNVVGQGAPLVVAVIAIPVLDAELGTARYGLLLIAWMLVGYFGLFDLGLGRALTQMVSDRLGAEDEDSIPTMIWTALAITGVVSLIGTVVVAASASTLVRYIVSDASEAVTRDSVLALLVVSLTVPFVVSTACLRGVLAARQRFDIINALRIPMGIFTFAGPLIVLPFAPTLLAVMVVLLGGRILGWVAHIIFSVREFPALWVNRRIDRSLIRPLLGFGGWMTVSNLVSPVMVYLDRLLIGIVLTASAVAYYATPWEIVTKLLIIPTAIAGVLFPSISFWQSRSASQISRLFFTGLKITGLVLLPLCMLVIAFAETGLEVWMGSDYAHNGTVPMQLLTIGIFLNGMASVPFAVLQGHRRPDITAKLHLAELPLYLVLLFVLIASLGLVGVALAWAIRVAVDLALLLALSRRYVPGNTPEFRRIVAGTIAAACLMGALMFIDDMLLAGLAAAAACFAGGVASWKYLLNLEEIGYLKGLLARWVRLNPSG